MTLLFQLFLDPILCTSYDLHWPWNFEIITNSYIGPLFFFDKQAHILKKARSREAYRKYTRLQPLKQKTKQPNPYLEAIHSKKPIREFDSMSMYTLAQPKKLYTNEVFNFWKANTPPLKASLFLSFHIDQKMKSGMDFHTFFLFFHTKEPFQLLRTSFTEFGKTHCTPHNARMISHNPFATVQWIKIWLIVSSSHPHKKHR